MVDSLDWLGIVTPSRTGVNARTRAAIEACEKLGAKRLGVEGVSDVAAARNILLTQAVQLGHGLDVLLLVDEDMLFTVEQATTVATAARESQQAVSGTYITNAGKLAHTPRDDGLWLSGLGFLAVPMPLMQRLATALGLVQGLNGMQFIPFCQSRVKEGSRRWFSEDYWFCDSLGGVRLLPVPIKHLKVVELSPDPRQLERVSMHNSSQR